MSLVDAEEVRAGEIGLLEQDHAEPAAGGIARDAAAIHPAADHREIVGGA